MKKLAVLLFVAIFIIGAVPLLAQDAPKSSPPQKSLFQTAGDDISKIGINESGSSGPVTDVFQSSSDYIIKSSPRAKQLSLRDNPRELKRRRGGR